MADTPPSGDMRQALLAMNPLQLSLLVSITFVFVFSLLNLAMEQYLLGQVEMLMVLSMAGIFLWTRKADIPVWQNNFYLLHPAALFALLFLQGGYNEIGFIWSFSFPFLACLVAGSRAGLAWTVLYAVGVVVLNGAFGDVAWQRMLYIGLGYVAFSMIAIYAVLWREKIEQSSRSRLFETSALLKQKSHALADEKIGHRSLLDALPSAVAVHSDAKWIYCNPSAALLLGADTPEEVIGTSIYSYVHEDDHERLKARIEQMVESGRPSSDPEFRLLRRNGDILITHIESSPIRHEGHLSFLVTAEDASQRQRANAEHHELKAQLEHAQRLESLGVLAGGIAHDFNNLLAAILGNAELMKNKLDDKAATKGHIENIVESCDHASELCKQMLAYAGKGSYELNVLNLNDMVKSMGKLIRASVSSNIALKTKLDSELPGIEGDTAQVQQLILNFIVNSADAIGSDAGEIKVSTGVRQMRREQLDRLYNGTQLPEGQYVVIEVRDNGCGMSPEMQARIFDPFFTTKETGSGLGLSAVLGIVRGHHGAIQVFSSPGEGTAFRVYLPSTDQPFREKMVTTVEVEAWQGDGTVLVVDDDLRVRNVASSFIEKLNFDVMTAEDGKEGVEIFSEHHRNLVAVLLDMTMPVLGGVEAMAAMRKIDASVPIILVSGYSETEAGTLIAADQRPDAFLQKPFKAKDLKTTFYEVMHRESQA